MPTFREEFERVRNLVVLGNAHLQLWKGLSKRLQSDQKRVIANVAPTFFGLTLESHLDTAFLYAAKAFDTHRDSLNLRTIVKAAKANEDRLLSAEGLQEMERVARESDAKISGLESSLKAIRTRRDKIIAHLDPHTVSRPEEITKQSQINADELQNVFAVAWRILNEISVLCWDLSAFLELVDGNDFEHALDLIEREKRRQFAEYEAEFGPFPSH